MPREPRRPSVGTSRQRINRRHPVHTGVITFESWDMAHEDYEQVCAELVPPSRRSPACRPRSGSPTPRRPTTAGFTCSQTPLRPTASSVRPSRAAWPPTRISPRSQSAASPSTRRPQPARSPVSRSSHARSWPEADVMSIDNDTLNAFLGQFVADLGATTAAGNVVIGHRLGLYHAPSPTARSPPTNSPPPSTHVRPIREWLYGQAAGGYVIATDDHRFTSSPEQAFCLADPDGAVYLPGAFQLALGGCGARRESASPSAPARAWARTSTMRRSSSAARPSSDPVTSPPHGFRRSATSSSACRTAAGSPTSAAV